MNAVQEIKFLLPCYRRLKRQLGSLDALIECNEISVRELVKSATSAKSKNEYLKFKSEEHGVRVDTASFQELAHRLSHLYLLSVDQQREVFVQEFCEEHPEAEKWHGCPKDTEKVKFILQQIGPTFDAARKCVGRYEYEVVDYYRLVRNAFLHEGENTSEAEIQFKAVKRLTMPDEYRRLEAPNVFDELRFDDFILYSRALKILARSICAISKPRNESIAKQLRAFNEDPNSNFKFSQFRGLKNNKSRMKCRLNNYLRCAYNLNLIDSAEVFSLIESELLA